VGLARKSLRYHKTEIHSNVYIHMSGGWRSGIIWTQACHGNKCSHSSDFHSKNLPRGLIFLVELFKISAGSAHLTAHIGKQIAALLYLSST
jgi:hypothetical protein